MHVKTMIHYAYHTTISVMVDCCMLSFIVDHRYSRKNVFLNMSQQVTNVNKSSFSFPHTNIDFWTSLWQGELILQLNFIFEQTSIVKQLFSHMNNTTFADLFAADAILKFKGTK